MTWRSWLVALALPLMAAAAVPADVVGTLTVKGKTTPLRYAVAAKEKDADSQEWLVILLSDVAVGDADRTPSRLAELAAAGRLRAVRVVWKSGYDFVRAAPYHQALSQSGRIAVEHPTLNLERYDERRFEGDVKSKMLGQEWFFDARIKAPLVSGGRFELEPEAEDEPIAATGAEAVTTAKKRALGKLGYAFTVEMFVHAIQDTNVEAVGLFLEAGMSPNTNEPPERQPLMAAVTQCAYRHEAEAVKMATMLLKAGAKVDGTAGNGITPLLIAAQHCEGPELVALLIKAGANVNTRAPGGGTPMMLAKAMNRKATEELLVKAGARE